MAKIREFESTNESYFILDGVSYPKVYEAMIDSGYSKTKIKLVSTSRDTLPLVFSTEYTNIRVDGNSFANAQEAISRLNQVVFSKGGGSGGGGTVLAGYKGEAQLNTEPEQEGAWWYIVHTAGTYTNFKDSGNAAIVVTEADLDVVGGVARNRVILQVEDGVATKRIEATGIEGRSAYQVAVDNGFVGSEAEWLDSLNGKYNDLFDTTVGKNKFNKATAISGLWITSLGTLEGNEPSIVSEWIPVDDSKIYHISGRPTGGLRFRDASGNIMQPLVSPGVPDTDFSLAGSNGIIYVPTGAVELQFTVTLSGNGDINAVQLEEGGDATAYEPYTEIYSLKQDAIPPLDYVTDADLDGYLKKTDILQRVNLFDKDNVVNGKYITSSIGVLDNDAGSAVSAIIPVDPSTIYYLQGKTIPQREMVFYDISGNRLKPRDINGIESADFTMPTVNGPVMSPPTAVSVQFTVKFIGNGSLDNIMFSKSTVEQPYLSYDTFVLKDTVQQESSHTFKVVKQDGGVNLRTEFDSAQDVHVTFDTTAYTNGLYNISFAKLLTKSDDDGAAGTVLNGVGDDDSGPSFFNNTIIGGNHGSPMYRITATAHGKTLADVGAKYTDNNGNEFTIIKIADANTLLLGIKNTSVTTGWVFPAPVTPLTYLSNGNSTTGVSFTASVGDQLRPSIKNVVQKLVIDGEEKSANGTYYGDKVNIIETYDIIDYPDMLAKLTANRPIGGYLTQPTFTNGDAVISITNIFNVQPKGTISIVCTWEAVKTLLLDRFFGITQNGFGTPSWATTVRRYFPKTLPITNNGNTFDFRLKPEFKTPVITGYIGITPEYWEDGKPVNRVVDMLQSEGLNANFNLGYLPLGGNRADMVNNAWEMTPTKKLYPRYIDGKIGAANVVTAGTVKQGVAFRGWSKPSGIRTNEFLVENGGKYYLYLDYHTAGTDTIELPSYLLGKSVSVIDKSANVELLTNIVTGDVKVKITASTPMYGYCELLIQ